MVFLAASDQHLVLGFSGQLLVLTTSQEQPKSFLLSLPELRPELKHKPIEQKVRHREDNPICGCFSSCGRWFAVADAHKRLLVWIISDSEQQKQQDSWTLYREFSLEKRSVSIQYIPGQEAFLVGDKSCDVYQYNLKDDQYSQGRLLLGHVSMLLDLQLSSDQKFIATCDRDEKIRISQYPKCHQIQSFCLGHREFVTTCTFVDEQRLVSGSGDGTIACWEYRTGRLIFSTKIDYQLNDDNEQKNDSENSLIGVCRVISLDNQRVVVVLFNSSEILLYNVEANKFSLHQRLDVDSEVIEAVRHKNHIWLITRNHCLQCVQLQDDSVHLVETPLTEIAIKNAENLRPHLQQLDTRTFYEQLYKNLFDNVEKYYENKRKRQGGQRLQFSKITSSISEDKLHQEKSN